MALSKVGGGSQVGDGNIAEVQLFSQGDVASGFTSAATFTAANLTAGILSVTPGSNPIAYTLPTVAALETALVNVHNGSSFDFSVINLASATNVADMTTATGWTLVGAVGISAASSGTFRARKTGDSAWSLYRLA
jgi:hypothetical protein